MHVHAWGCPPIPYNENIHIKYSRTVSKNSFVKKGPLCWSLLPANITAVIRSHHLTLFSLIVDLHEFNLLLYGLIVSIMSVIYAVTSM